MTIENFSGDAQTFERGSTNLYAQVSTDIRGGFESFKQDSNTGKSYLPDLQLGDGGTNFISAPRNLGEDRRKAAEQSGKQQEAPGRKEDSNQKRPSDEEVQKSDRPRGSLGENPARQAEGPPGSGELKVQRPADALLQRQGQGGETTRPAQHNGNEGPLRGSENKGQQPAEEALPRRQGPTRGETRPAQQNGTEGPSRKEEPGQKEQQGQGSKGSEREQNKQQPKDCVDFGSVGSKVMEKPTNWKPDTELKTKQGQEWNKHAQELRNKPLKTDKDGNYQVQYGDSLWGIAERSVKERTGKAASPADTYKEMQRIVGMNADKLGSQSNWQMIKPGMQLRVKAENACEVPGKAAETPKQPGKVVETPKQPGKVAEQQTNKNPDQNTGKSGEQENRAQQRPDQNDKAQENKGEKATQQTERTTIGKNGQKVTVDAQDRVTKIESPDGAHAKIEYSGNSKEISRAVVTRDDGVTVIEKDGKDYKVTKDGKETKERYEKVEINKDNTSLVITPKKPGWL